MTAPATWNLVRAVFADGNACADCPHLNQWTEYHGPGLREPMAECRLMECGSDPSECPGLATLESST